MASCSTMVGSCWLPARPNPWLKWPSGRRSRWCSLPGISATVTPMCRSSVKGCACGAITCWRRWRQALAPRSRSSTRRSIPRRLRRITSMTMAADEASSAALYRLMAWLSPSYPVGAFSYSSGIEWAVETGDIKDADTLRRWLAIVIGEGGGFCDAVFFAHAHRSLVDTDDRALRAVAELAAAFAP